MDTPLDKRTYERALKVLKGHFVHDWSADHAPQRTDDGAVVLTPKFWAYKVDGGKVYALHSLSIGTGQFKATESEVKEAFLRQAQDKLGELGIDTAKALLSFSSDRDDHQRRTEQLVITLPKGSFDPEAVAAQAAEQSIDDTACGLRESLVAQARHMAKVGIAPSEKARLVAEFIERIMKEMPAAEANTFVQAVEICMTKHTGVHNDR